MTGKEKIQTMSTDELTNFFIRILTCKRCFCRDLCQQLKSTNGANNTAPCAVAISSFLENEVEE